MRRLKLKYTIFVVLLIFTLIPLYVFGLFMMIQNDKNIEEIMGANLEAVSGTQILAIKNFCEARKESLEMIAGYDIIHDAVRESLDGAEDMPPKQKEYLNNILAERSTYNDYVESISVINKDFIVVASSEKYAEDKLSDLQKVDKEYLDSGFFISNIVERRKGNEKIKVLFACKRIEKNGELMGYILEEIRPSYFNKNRTETNSWNGTLYLLDGNDQVITAGTSTEERDQYITSESERKGYTETWNKVDLEKEPSGKISYRVGGTDYITYYSVIDYTDWNIKVTLNLSEYQNSKAAYRLLLFAALVVVSVLLLVVNYLITKRLTRPVENIVGTLKRIQDDQDYSLRIRDNGEDEIGVLSSEINNLLEYIEKEDLQEKERQRYLAKEAEKDPLTGVKNKKALEESLRDMLRRAAANNERAAVGFLDIDDFRDYNSKYGHQMGDDVIRFVAAVVEESIKGIVGRNGGDEFMFGIEHVEDLSVLEQDIAGLMENLNKGVFCRESRKTTPVPCSIGIAVAEGGELRYSSMVRLADEAMYRAKESGKNTYRFADLTQSAQLDRTTRN